MPRKRETRRLSSNLGTAALFREIKTQADFQKRRSKRGEGVRPASKGPEALGWRPMQQPEVGLRDGVEVRTRDQAHTPPHTPDPSRGRVVDVIKTFWRSHCNFILHCASSDDSQSIDTALRPAAPLLNSRQISFGVSVMQPPGSRYWNLPKSSGAPGATRTHDLMRASNISTSQRTSSSLSPCRTKMSSPTRTQPWNTRPEHMSGIFSHWPVATRNNSQLRVP